jgi:hypothetical protein
MDAYLKIVFATAALVAFSVAAFIYTVDPLGIYHPDPQGFYPAATAYARLKKAEDVKRLRPDVVITGTSRAEIGLDPRPEFFPGLISYNFALAASSINEQRRTLEFAEAAHPLKMAVITLDFFAFNAHRVENRQFDPERFSPAALSPVKSFAGTWGELLSLDMLIAATKHRRYMRHPEKYGALLPNGRKTNGDVEQYILKHGAQAAFAAPPNAAEISVDDFSFDYSATPGDNTFKHVEAMLDLARKNNTKVILIISPVHEMHLRALENAGQEKNVEAWKTRLAQIARANGEKYNAAPYPLWDFATRNAITTRDKLFWDSNHYRVEVGDMILREALGKAHYPGFGRRL